MHRKRNKRIVPPESFARILTLLQWSLTVSHIGNRAPIDAYLFGLPFPVNKSIQFASLALSPILSSFPPSNGGPGGGRGLPQGYREGPQRPSRSHRQQELRPHHASPRVRITTPIILIPNHPTKSFCHRKRNFFPGLGKECPALFYFGIFISKYLYARKAILVSLL